MSILPEIHLDLDDLAMRFVASLPSLDGAGVDEGRDLVYAVEAAYFRALRTLRGPVPKLVGARLSRSQTIDALVAVQGLECGYCGVPLDRRLVRNAPTAVQIDHMTARANGGTDDLENLTLACPPCNVAKGTKSVSEFMALLRAGGLV